MDKRKVILVTDGDCSARHALEVAAHNIGGRCISASAGNPTVLTGHEIVGLVKQAEKDPVIVMVDDRGYKGKGMGEMAMDTILHSRDVDVIGILAVSSKGKDCNGIKVSCSVTKYGKVIERAVDKYGNDRGKKELCGDTLSILRNMKDMVIVGIGDPGKMDFQDDVLKGSPITTKALMEVMKRSGYRS